MVAEGDIEQSAHTSNADRWIFSGSFGRSEIFPLLATRVNREESVIEEINRHLEDQGFRQIESIRPGIPFYKGNWQEDSDNACILGISTRSMKLMGPDILWFPGSEYISSVTFPNLVRDVVSEGMSFIGACFRTRKDFSTVKRWYEDRARFFGYEIEDSDRSSAMTLLFEGVRYYLYFIPDQNTELNYLIIREGELVGEAMPRITCNIFRKEGNHNSIDEAVKFDVAEKVPLPSLELSLYIQTVFIIINCCLTRIHQARLVAWDRIYTDDCFESLESCTKRLVRSPSMYARGEIYGIMYTMLWDIKMTVEQKTVHNLEIPLRSLMSMWESIGSG